jgi:hypothetical protein
MGLFTDRNKPIEQPPAPSWADVTGAKPGPPTAEHLAGIEAGAVIAKRQSDVTLARYEASRDARLKATKELEDEVWARITARQRQAIG